MTANFAAQSVAEKNREVWHRKQSIMRKVHI